MWLTAIRVEFLFWNTESFGRPDSALEPSDSADLFTLNHANCASGNGRLAEPAALEQPTSNLPWFSAVSGHSSGCAASVIDETSLAH
jgi:hypothetical protein